MKTECCGNPMRGCVVCPPAAPQPHLTPVGAGEGNTYVVSGYSYGPQPTGQPAGSVSPGCVSPAAGSGIAFVAPAAPAAEPVGWVPVTARMPKSGQTVLACYTNRAGNVRRIRAEWVAAKSREATSDDSDIGVYDEATDTFYDPEGWYERIDNWGDYSAVFVTEGEVTHWMPLPAAPGAAPAQSREPLTEKQIRALVVQSKNLSEFIRAIERAHGIGSQP